MTESEEKRERFTWHWSDAASVVSYAAWQAAAPLFAGTQVTYFLHGIRSVSPWLERDWQAATKDPYPVFSSFIEVLARLGVLDAGTRACQVLLAAALYLGVRAIVSAKGSLLVSLVSLAVATSALTDEALAGHFALDADFAPTSVCALLVLAIGLRRFSWLSILPVALALLIHPMFCLSAALLVLWSAHQGTTGPWRTVDRTWPRATCTGPGGSRRTFLVVHGALLAFSVIVALWTLARFRETDEAIAAQGRSVLLWRIRYHVNPELWLKGTFPSSETPWVTRYEYPSALTGALNAGRAALWVIGIVALRKLRRPEHQILSAAGVITLAGVVLALVTKNEVVRVWMPWRVSTWALHVAGAGLAAWVFSLPSAVVGRRFAAGMMVASAAWIVFDTIVGRHGMAFVRGSAYVEAMREAKGALPPSLCAAVPVTWFKARTRGEWCIFVDRKTHPYAANELVEWKRRVDVAQRFYDGASCELLDEPGVDVVFAPAGFRTSCALEPFRTIGRVDVYLNRAARNGARR